MDFCWSYYALTQGAHSYALLQELVCNYYINTELSQCCNK